MGQVATFTEAQRAELWRLFDVEGLQTKQISERLGIKYTTVRSQINRKNSPINRRARGLPVEDETPKGRKKKDYCKFSGNQRGYCPACLAIVTVPCLACEARKHAENNKSFVAKAKPDPDMDRPVLAVAEFFRYVAVRRSNRFPDLANCGVKIKKDGVL